MQFFAFYTCILYELRLTTSKKTKRGLYDDDDDDAPFSFFLNLGLGLVRNGNRTQVVPDRFQKMATNN